MPLRTSNLSKTFPEMLQDTSSTITMLDYFIQYLESIHALHMLQFWFLVEAFKTSTVNLPEYSDSKDSHHPLCNHMTAQVGTENNVETESKGKEKRGKSQRKVLQRRDTENYKYCNCKIHEKMISPSLPPSQSNSLPDSDPVTVPTASEQNAPTEKVERSEQTINGTKPILHYHTSRQHLTNDLSQ